MHALRLNALVILVYLTSFCVSGTNTKSQIYAGMMFSPCACCAVIGTISLTADLVHACVSLIDALSHLIQE